MKFLLEFVTCCTSSPTEPPPLPVETKYLVLQSEEPRRRGSRKHWRVRPGVRRCEWRPSLTSISEDVLTAEDVKNVEERPVRRRWRWSIKRKFALMSQRGRSAPSLDHKESRSAPLSVLMQSPTPFMF